VEVSFEAVFGGLQVGDGGLWDDRLAQGGGELAQHAPSAGVGQAVAERGESSSASTSGSSKRIIRR